MSFFGFDLLPELDPVAGAFILPFWMGAAAAALFVTVLALALTRAGAHHTGAVLARYAVVVVGAVMAFTFLERSETRDRVAERRAVDGGAPGMGEPAVRPAPGRSV